MTSDDVIMVLDAICEKLGIAIDDVTQIIPLYAKYEIFVNAELLIISIIITTILLVLIIKHFKTLREEGLNFFEDEDTFMADILTIIGIIITGIFVLILICSLTGLLEWSIFPEMKMVSQVLSTFK